MNVALSHSGYNRQFLAFVLVLAVAEQQVHTRLACLGGHLTGVCHFHAEFAGTLVNHQTTALEDCLDLAVVEVLERDIVLQQRVEVALHVQQFAQRLVLACGCVHGCLVGCRDSGNFCLVCSNLRGQFLPILVGNLRLSLRIGYCQTHLLQLCRAEPGVVCSLVLMYGGNDIGCQWGFGQRLLLNGNSTDGCLYGCQTDRLLLAGYAARNFGHLLGIGVLLVQVSNLQLVFLLQQYIRIAQHGAQVLRRIDDLVNTDLAVMIGV